MVVGRIIRIAILAVLLIVLIFIQNNRVFNYRYIYESPVIPKTFVGYKIMQISDLSNKPMNTKELIFKENPDLVIFTGNYADEHGYYDASLNLIIKTAEKYNTMYVFGDQDEPYIDNMFSALSKSSAIYAEDDIFTVSAPEVKFDDFINKYIEASYLKDRDDPESTISKYLEYTQEALEEDQDKYIEIIGISDLDNEQNLNDYILDMIDLGENNFRVMIASQGQYIYKMAETPMNLVLTGNTYGIDRFNTGFSKGIYNVNGTTISLSGGIGKNPDGGSRIFNFPRVITLTLSDGTINNLNPLEKFLGKYITNVETRFDNDQGFKQGNTTYSNGKEVKD